MCFVRRTSFATLTRGRLVAGGGRCASVLPALVQPRRTYLQRCPLLRAPPAAATTKPPRRSWWARFRAKPLWRKVLSLTVTYPFLLLASYFVLCCTIHTLHVPTLFTYYYPAMAIEADRERREGGRAAAPASTDLSFQERNRRLAAEANHAHDLITRDRVAETHNINTTWAEVEPTLQPGDVLLMRGGGLLSWLICTAHLGGALLVPSSMRYSHIAVVVAPAVYEADPAAVPPRGRHARWWWPFGRGPTAAEVLREEEAARARAAATEAEAGSDPAVSTYQGRRRVRGALILEAMANDEYKVEDIHGNVVVDQVQVVEAWRRLCSVFKDDDGRLHPQQPAYHFCGVRHLYGVPRDAATEAQLAQFIRENEGRTMDANPAYILNIVSNTFYHWLRPQRSAVYFEVSCSELIMELYQKLGLIQRHWRWVPLPAGDSATAAYEQYLGSRTDVDPPVHEGARLLLQPTRADRTQSTAYRSDTHVYELITARRAVVEARRLEDQPRPVVAPYATVEGGETLQTAPTTGPLRAGHLARRRDGGLAQLQYYYKYDSSMYAPMHFTEMMSDGQFDFVPGVSFGEEILLGIPGRRGREGVRL